MRSRVTAATLDADADGSTTPSSDEWPSVKGRDVLASLLRIGWRVKRTTGSHRVLALVGRPNVVFAFGDGEEIGPRMLARIARSTGLVPEDL